MTNRLRNPIDMPAVSSVTPAPHRYTWDADQIDGSFKIIDGEVVPRGRDFVALAPYKVGDVVYIVWGEGFALAYISHVGYDYDMYGDRRHKYRVHKANKRGDTFSKTFHYTWPGMIQRAYVRAGLAPDCEGKV
jgi:hypothetical protein